MMLIISITPIAVLLIALTLLRMKAWQATLFSFLTSLIFALFFFGDSLRTSEIPQVVFSGIAFALCPICLVVLAALFTYSITVESGAMEKIRVGLASISDDRRVLALLIVWGFGTFIEGMAGFGTAVAIPAAILVAVGFDPVKSVMMCLVANTTPTAYGSVGVPLMTLAAESGTNIDSLSWMTSFLQLSITVLGPVLILLVYDGVRALKGMWFYIFVAETAFLVPSLLAARYVGAELPDIAGGVGVMLTLFAVSKKNTGMCEIRSQLFAWLPFAFVVIILAANALLPDGFKRYTTPGALVLTAGFIGGLCQGLKLLRLLKILFITFRRYIPAFTTICFVLAMGRIMTEAGMISLIATSLVALAGSAYPAVSTLLGAIGGFVTGSGTSSCVLFGRLQADAALQLGRSPELFAAANVMGAGIGKMICPQSIAIGVAAAGLAASGESVLFRRMLPWFACVIILASIVTIVMAFFEFGFFSADLGA